MHRNENITLVSTWDETQLQALAEIHCAVLPYQGWDAQAFASLLSGDQVFLTTALQNSAPVGFIVWREISGESEILTVAVAPSSQRKTIGQQLVTHMLAHAGKRECFLEVAANNMAAQNLYLKLGFVPSGRRKNYYFQGPFPAVDAICMKRPCAG